MKISKLLFFFLVSFLCAFSLSSDDNSLTSLGEVLNPDGTVMAGVSGSFDPRGFSMSYLQDGSPLFTQKAGTPFYQRDSGTWNALGTGLNSTVFAIAISGTDVYVGGDFTDAGGNSYADYIARWDGVQWNALGTGLNGSVHAIAISGTDVYVGGGFTDAGGDPNADRITRWDGTSWHALGTGLTNWVVAIAISGTDVYVGGTFQNAGGNPSADRIARWDGTQWNPLGTGLNNYVWAIAISGSDVYVGGEFSDAGGNPSADRIARWDGVQWNALGTGLNNVAYAIATSGTDVYVGGYFTDAGGNPSADYIARWDGVLWNTLGTGLSDIVLKITISGTDVYVGGGFTNAGGDPNADNIARWDGTKWCALGSGLTYLVREISISGTDVYVGGEFWNAGGIPSADNIALWSPFRDAQSFGIISPPSDTLLPSIQSIVGVVTNNGAVTENFNIHMTVSDQTEAVVLDTTVNTVALTGVYDTIGFGQITITHLKTYTLTMVTLLSGDMNSSNDTLTSQCFCVDLPPDSFSLVSPENSAMLNFLRPMFMWVEAPDNNLKFYEVYIDDTSRVQTADTFWNCGFDLSNGIHTWFVRAIDSSDLYRNSNETWTLEIDTMTPSAPTLLYPAGGIYLGFDTIYFNWTQVLFKGLDGFLSFNKRIGEEARSPVEYVFELDTSSSFASPVSVDTLGTNSVFKTLTENINFFWRVRAFDMAGNQGSYSSIENFTIDMTPPVIESTTIWPDTTFSGPFSINTKVMDQFSLDTVFLFYKRSEDQFWISTEMTNTSGGWFHSEIPSLTVFPSIIRYYIYARDLSQPFNESTDPAGAPAGPYSFQVTSVGTEEGLPVLPEIFRVQLASVSSEGVIFNLSIPVASDVSLRIYDLSGRLVSTPVNSYLAPAYYSIVFKPQICGIYFYSVESDRFNERGKFLVVD